MATQTQQQTTDRVKHATLTAAICGVIADTGNVPKTGQNKFHGYAYATDADIMQECRRALARHGVIVVLKEPRNVRISERAGNKGSDVYYEADFAFGIMHADTDQTIEVVVPAGGQDKGEKAPYKALTGAKKYLYLTTFALATGGDDPEDDRGSRAAAQAEPDPSVYMTIAHACEWAKAVETATKLRATRVGSVKRVLGDDVNLKSFTDLGAEPLAKCIDWLRKQPTVVQRDDFTNAATALVLDATTVSKLIAKFGADAKGYDDLTVVQACKLAEAMTDMLKGRTVDEVLK